MFIRVRNGDSHDSEGWMMRLQKSSCSTCRTVATEYVTALVLGDGLGSLSKKTPEFAKPDSSQHW